MKRLYIFVLLPIVILGLSSCSTVKDRDRVGVKEAKSCIKQKQKNSILLDQYQIKACTNNGIWIAINTETKEEYDFLNKTYTNSQYETFAFSDLSDGDKRGALGLQKRINAELLDLY
jgi:hypothetical protein